MEGNSRTKDSIIAEFAGFLNQFNWTYFANLTFDKDIKDPLCAFKHFKRLMYRMGAKKAFVVAEWFKIWTAVHLHALIEVFIKTEWKRYHDWWEKHYGICWWREYEANKGAKYYLSKYLLKEVADWNFFTLKDLSYLSYNICIT